MQAFGEMVKRKRKAKGWTQLRLAAETGGLITQSAISAVEKGKGRRQPATVRLLAEALEEDAVEWLRRVGYVPEQPDPVGAIAGPDDPLRDVIEEMRRDPALVEDFRDAKRRMTPAVYRGYIRLLAGTWRENYKATVGSFRLAASAAAGEDEDGEEPSRER